MKLLHRSAPHLSICAAMIATCFAVAGCGTRGMTDAMAPIAEPAGLPQPGSANYQPVRSQSDAQAAAAQARVERQASVSAATQTPTNTGAFPNLNIRPNAAAAQLTPEQSKALLADLRSTQNRLNATNRAAARSVPDAATLRRIGTSHGDATLNAIESQSSQ